MFKQFFALFSLGLCITANTFAPSPSHAQDPATSVPSFNFLHTDAEGILQVWHFDGETRTSEMLTHSASDVVSFTVANTSPTIVYETNETLYIQADATATAETLLKLSGKDVELGMGLDGHPLFSPDDSLLAYANDGLWIRDMATGTDTQYLVNEHETGGGNFYMPYQFLADGKTLLFRHHMFETRALGTLNLQTSEIESWIDKEGSSFYNAFLLSDGRFLLFTSSVFAGRPDIHIVDPANFADHSAILDVSKLDEDYLMVSSMLVMPDNKVRMAGMVMGRNTSGFAGAFYFDYDLTTGTASEVTRFALVPSEDEAYTYTEKLVGGGHWILEYQNVNPNGTLAEQQGEPVLVNLLTGETVSIPLE